MSFFFFADFQKADWFVHNQNYFKKGWQSDIYPFPLLQEDLPHFLKVKTGEELL